MPQMCFFGSSSPGARIQSQQWSDYWDAEHLDLQEDWAAPAEWCSALQAYMRMCIEPASCDIFWNNIRVWNNYVPVFCSIWPGFKPLDHRRLVHGCMPHCKEGLQGWVKVWNYLVDIIHNWSAAHIMHSLLWWQSFSSKQSMSALKLNVELQPAAQYCRRGVQ